MLGMHVEEQSASFDESHEAAVIKECIQSDRSIELKQDLEVTTPNSNPSTPIRSVKCRKKHCKQYEFSTDLKEIKKLLKADEASTKKLNQMNGVSIGKSKIKLAGGKTAYLSHNLEVKCPSNHLATKFSEGVQKEHFYIENRKWTNQYLTVTSCNQGSRIKYSKKDDGNVIQRTFYANGNTIHSAFCGDKMALDLEGNGCFNGGKIHLWQTNGSNAQKFTFGSNGWITIGGCRLDGGGSANQPYLYVWKDRIETTDYFFFETTEDLDHPWWKWNKITIPHKTREIWCKEPDSSAGIIIDENDIKSTGTITSDESSGDPPAACPDGYYVSGYKCEDYFCYSFSLICKKIKVSFMYTLRNDFSFQGSYRTLSQPSIFSF